MRLKELIISFVALLFSTLPPLIATASYFPIWAEKSGTHVISGFALLLTLICISPIFKIIKRTFESPSVTTVWLIVFALFFALSKIAEEMIVISFVGFIGNLIGSLLFRLARKSATKREGEKR